MCLCLFLSSYTVSYILCDLDIFGHKNLLFVCHTLQLKEMVSCRNNRLLSGEKGQVFL